MKAAFQWTMVTILLVVPAPGALGETADSDQLIKDCGVNSLYLLLRMREAPVDLAQLRAALPATKPAGLSMAELQAAAGRYGVPVRGKRIGPGDVPLDRPVIALFQEEGGPGHFVVLEPVGVLGKSVMVLDFPRPAQVFAYADLIRGGKWTGLVLAPVTAWDRFGPGVAAAAGIALAGFGCAHPWMCRLRSKRDHAPMAVGLP